MDSCTAVEREVDKVASKFDGYSNNYNKQIQQQIQHLEDLKKRIQGSEEAEVNSVHKTDLKLLTLKVSECVGKLAGDHRDLHSTVSKVGKSIDRNFSHDFDSTYEEEFFSGSTKEHLLNEVILQHLYRQGQLDISESLAQESGIHEYKSQKEPFVEMNKILQALKSYNLEPAMEWAEHNREALNLNKSVLELRLHKLKFIKLLASGDRTKAIMYARQYFPRFVQGEEKEVKELMGALMFCGPALSTSPYAHLVDDNHWVEIQDLFLRDACALLGLSIESPLGVAVEAGCMALPALLNFKHAMTDRKEGNTNKLMTTLVDVWNGRDELPIEIELPNNMRFHSVFACPILRQQVSDGNPPMRLICGHIISKDALSKLSSSHSKLKCPYCPVEQNPAEAKKIVF
eukprot:TRINITY_DN6533_c0_g1_i1.p1 TRINITY_DN6533_c0_g1~~TRINITY_DN6533_c0_g1_i1.p1  ORF type:complete len:401 (-),score=88.61 TRINITY_DN6533_c0_g1_i1:187-1389(-)